MPHSVISDQQADDQQSGVYTKFGQSTAVTVVTAQLGSVHLTIHLARTCSDFLRYPVAPNGRQMEAKTAEIREL